MRHQLRRLRSRRCAQDGDGSGTGEAARGDPNRLMPGRKQVLDNAASLFARGRAVRDGEEERERETANLHDIGQRRSKQDFWPGARAMSAPERRVERPGKDPFGAPPMRACGRGNSEGLPPSPSRRRQSGGDAPDRRTASRNFRSDGSRRMTFELNKEGRGQPQAVRRADAVMGIEVLVPRPGTSKAAPGHKIYPYLLRGLKIVEPNHVWAADVTYIPMGSGRAVRKASRTSIGFGRAPLRKVDGPPEQHSALFPLAAHS